MTIPKDLKERMILKLQSYDDGYDYDEDEAIRLIKIELNIYQINAFLIFMNG